MQTLHDSLEVLYYMLLQKHERMNIHNLVKTTHTLEFRTFQDYGIRNYVNHICMYVCMYVMYVVYYVYYV